MKQNKKYSYPIGNNQCNEIEFKIKSKYKKKEIKFDTWFKKMKSCNE